MIIQLLIVLVAIIVGARMGGIGLGVMGGIGLMILTFVFGLQPTAPPMDVMLMIAAVIAAAYRASAPFAQNHPRSDHRPNQPCSVRITQWRSSQV